MPSVELIQAVAVTAELCGRVFSEGAARTFVSDLAAYPEPAVLKALTRCRREVKGMRSTFLLLALVLFLPLAFLASACPLQGVRRKLRESVNQESGWGNQESGRGNQVVFHRYLTVNPQLLNFLLKYNYLQSFLFSLVALIFFR